MFTLATLAAAALAAPPPNTTPATPTTELHSPDVPWHLTLALGNLKRFELEPDRPHHSEFDYRTDDGNMILGVAIEDVVEPATLAQCREVSDSRAAESGDGTKGLKTWQSGEAVMQEYEWHTTLNGHPYVEHNVYSCRVRGTHFINVHAVKLDPGPSDAAMLRTLVENVRIVD